MKKDLKKELLKYTSAAAAVLAVTEVQAQYQYTNIPDTTVNLNNGFYNLDLDQDGTPDFVIRQYVDTGSAANTNAVIIQPYTNSGNRVAGEKIGQYNYPFNLQAATIINDSTIWNGAGGQFNTGYMAFEVDGQSYPNSNWVGPYTDGYLGLQIWKNNQRHYGWARLDVSDSSDSFTLKDFSVNLTPDSSIVVGFELLGEVENLLEGVKIAIGADFIELTKPSQVAQIGWRMRDVQGKLISEGLVQDSKVLIETTNWPVGIYILEMDCNGLVRREKLLVY